MNNGQRRNTEEKKAFRMFALNSGLNPYNIKASHGLKPKVNVNPVKQIINCKKTGKKKTIFHY